MELSKRFCNAIQAALRRSPVPGPLAKILLRPITRRELRFVNTVMSNDTRSVPRNAPSRMISHESRRYFLGRLVLVPLIGYPAVFALLLAVGFLPTRMLGPLAGRTNMSIVFQVWLIPALVGLAAGIWLNRRKLPLAHLFVWLIPCAVFVWAWSGHASSDQAWSELINPDCFEYECLAQFLFTIPAVFSLTFTIGTALQAARRRFISTSGS